MTRAIASNLIFLILFSSCSTSQNSNEQLALENNSNAQDLISNYIESQSLLEKGELKESCQILTELGKDEKFPEQSLIFIKKLETCEYLPQQLTKIWETNQYLPKWILPEFVKISLKLATEHSMETYIAKFSYLYAKYEKFQKDKIARLQKAIAISKKYELHDQLALYTKRLEKIAPRFNQKVTRKNIYFVARDTERNRNFKKARGLYWAIVKNKKYGIDLIFKSYNRIRLSYKNERDMKNYLKYTKKMYQIFNRGRFYRKYRVKTALTYARAVWTDHKRNQAKKILRTTLKENKLSNENKMLIHWLLGSMKLENAMETPSKDLHYKSQAIWYFKKAESFKTKNLTMQDKIRWSISFTYYLQKNYQQSFKLFGQYKLLTKSDAFKSKFSFWAAKSLYSLKEYDESAKLFKELGQNDPFSYYGIMAIKESRESYRPLKSTGSSIKQLNLPRFEWLAALKEKKLAVTYLKKERRKIKQRSKRAGLLPLFHRLGSFDNMIHLYFSLSDNDKIKIMNSTPKYVYPRPFMEKVILAETKSGVDRNLILSISRQESAFNPLARSHADAFGVMQLLPERGRSVASEHKIPFKDYYDLFDPETNIMLGSILLAKLQKSFQHKFPLYVASYNASGLAVKRWYKDRYKGDFVKFIEMIPYAETQKYVKLVLRNYFIYKRLNSTESFLWNPILFNKA